MNYPITFITGNIEKVKLLSLHLHIPITHKKLDLPEIQSLDPQEIIEQKAKEAYKLINSPVLVEDTSLTFCSLGKLPGPLIKWFLEELDNAGLCDLLKPGVDRSAVATVTYGYYDGVELHIFEGTIPGSIALSPRGDQLFGWCPIFIPKGYEKTWAEMNLEEQDETSMRKIALKKLETFLNV